MIAEATSILVVVWFPSSPRRGAGDADGVVCVRRSTTPAAHAATPPFQEGKSNGRPGRPLRVAGILDRYFFIPTGRIWLSMNWVQT